MRVMLVASTLFYLFAVAAFCLFLVLAFLSTPCRAAETTLPIKVTILRCVSCAEATNMCQQGVSVCCPVKKRECHE